MKGLENLLKPEDKVKLLKYKESVLKEENELEGEKIDLNNEIPVGSASSLIDNNGNLVMYSNEKPKKITIEDKVVNQIDIKGVSVGAGSKIYINNNEQIQIDGIATDNQENLIYYRTIKKSPMGDVKISDSKKEKDFIQMIVNKGGVLTKDFTTKIKGENTKNPQQQSNRKVDGANENNTINKNDNKIDQDVSKLSLLEILKLGYSLSSPEVTLALEREKENDLNKKTKLLNKLKNNKEDIKARENATKESQFKKMIQEIKILEEEGSRFKTDNEKIELWKKISEKYNLGIVSIEPVKEDGNSSKEFALQKYNEAMVEIGNLIKEGIDKIVIHGNDFYNKDTDEIKGLRFKNDLDTEGALYFLNNVANIKYKEGASTEIVNKGGQSKENTGNVLYVDVGGRIIGVEKTKTGKKAFLDHHQEGFRAYETSAAEMAYDTLIKNKIIEDEPWMKNLAKFITNMDNLQYVKEKDFDLEFFKNKWPSSLYALAEKVPFEYIAQWFKEGRDPQNPFTDEEIKNMKIEKYSPASKKMGKHSLEGLIKTNVKNVGKSIANIAFAKEQMRKNGIKTRTKELGKVLYNTTEEVQDVRAGKNPINKIDINGFIPATAMGYDTFVSYNAQTQKYFINSVNYNLTNIYNRIKKLVPETKLVRGVMILPPNNESRKNITPEKLLEILDLK